MYLNIILNISWLPSITVEHQHKMYLNCKVVNPPLKYELVEHQHKMYLNNIAALDFARFSIVEQYILLIGGKVLLEFKFSSVNYFTSEEESENMI